jgi:outer membrane protein OmpA-like peptidoglycan-associated protein
MRLDPGRTGLLRHAIAGALALLAAVGPNAQTATAQAENQSGGGVGTHLLLGATVSRLDLDAGGRIDALGGRAGLGFGELVQITGFYWKHGDLSSSPRVPGRAAGGEIQLNLNAGFGLTPFLTAGAARLRLDTLDQGAAIAGAGVLLPLGPVLFRAAVSDYILGVSGLRNEHSPDETTHNWMFSAGVTAAFGRGRPRRVVERRPEPTVVRVAGDTVLVTRAPGELRNYQSDRRIEVPLPLEGSITIRYGPDAPPIVMATPDQRSSPDQRASDGDTAPFVSDPALQNWLRGEIAVQLAEQLRRQPATAVQGVPTGVVVDRITDEVLATIIPRLQSADVQRTAELREELRRLLDARLHAAPAPSVPFAAEEARTPPADPTVIPPASEDSYVEEAAALPIPEIRAERAARVRVRLAEYAARVPALLSTMETDRGPALVLGDAAFQPGGTLLTAIGQSALADIVELLETGGGLVFVQGHADGTGGEVDGQRFSELRAEAVRTAIVLQGFDSGRIVAVGYGRGRPVASDATASGRALNRRVEIVVQPAATLPGAGRQ